MEFMKWYKAYANLKGHPKRYRFEEALGVDHGLHYIHLWFSYIAEYAQDGDVTSFSKKEIAKACEWQGDPQMFFDALSVGGFVDKVKGGDGGSRLIAHDWFQENERYIKENEKRKPTGNPRVTRKKPALEEKRIEVREEKRKEQDLTADAVPLEVAIAPKVQEPHLQMRDYWHSEFEKRFKRKAAFIPAKWLVEAEKALLSQLTLSELKSRTHNCLEDGYKTNPRYVDFLKNNEDFATLRRFVIKGDPKEYESKRGKMPPPPRVLGEYNLPKF